ncbi:MAG: choline-sulfatase, partial [Verrucomicrobia bacterium]|nr:choline-sulfatase [Verrucomicrobiota bacterium]
NWKLHVYPKIDHQLLFNLATDPHEIKNLANDTAYQSQIEQMLVLMESHRTKLNDPYPLSIETPEPKEPNYDNDKRVRDRWQPQWIRDKYFDR